MYGFVPFPPPAKHAKLWKLYLAGSIAIDFGLVLGLVLYGGFALVTAIDDVGQYVNAGQSRSWQSVTGKISSSGSIREGKGFGVVAKYSYSVDGQDHTGNRLMFSARRPVVSTEAEADKLLTPFGRLNEENEFSGIFEGIIPRADRSVTVYYDPKSPQNSTLRQEYFANPELSGLWPAVPISALVLAILIGSIRTWFKYIRTKEYDATVRPRLPA